ncbi:hypothetical protein RhiirC2_790835, partial [Rhizophagus irregularis]
TWISAWAIKVNALPGPGFQLGLLKECPLGLEFRVWIIKEIQPELGLGCKGNVYEGNAFLDLDFSLDLNWNALLDLNFGLDYEREHLLGLEFQFWIIKAVKGMPMKGMLSRTWILAWICIESLKLLVLGFFNNNKTII